MSELVFSYENEPKSMLVVSHKGTIRSLVCLLLEHSSFPHNVESTDIPIGYNSVSHFELDIQDNMLQNCEVIKLFDQSHLK